MLVYISNADYSKMDVQTFFEYQNQCMQNHSYAASVIYLDFKKLFMSVAQNSRLADELCTKLRESAGRKFTYRHEAETFIVYSALAFNTIPLDYNEATKEYKNYFSGNNSSKILSKTVDILNAILDTIRWINDSVSFHVHIYNVELFTTAFMLHNTLNRFPTIYLHTPYKKSDKGWGDYIATDVYCMYWNYFPKDYPKQQLWAPNCRKVRKLINAFKEGKRSMTIRQSELIFAFLYMYKGPLNFDEVDHEMCSKSKLYKKWLDIYAEDES